MEVMMEPFEAVSIECPEEFTGIVIEKMGKRRGEMKDMLVENTTAFLEFEIPTRGLIGLQYGTQRTGIINTLLLGYREKAGDISEGSWRHDFHGAWNHDGLLIANLQARGNLFVGTGVEVRRHGDR